MCNRIVYVLGSGGVGGREKFLFELVEQQKEIEGISVAVIFLHAGGRYCDAIRELGVEVHCLKNERFLGKCKRLRRYLDQADSVVFKGYDFITHLGAIGYPGKRVFHLTGERYSSPRKKLRREKSDWGKSIRVKNKESPKSRLIIRSYNFFRRMLIYYCVKIFLKNMHKIITPSLFLKQYVINSFGIEKNKITVIHNFVNYERLTIKEPRKSLRTKLGLSQNTFLVGYVGRFDGRKRLDRLIRGFKQFCTLDEPIDKRLLLVGDGEPIRSMAGRLCAELNIEQKVIFVGFQKRVCDFLNACDAFILPSNSESFGLVIIEAMYLKKPVLVFKDSGGPLEIIENNINGIIVENEFELKNRLRDLAVEKSFYESIVENAYKRSLDFDRKIITEMYTNLLINPHSGF